MKNKGYFDSRQDLSRYIFQFQIMDVRLWLMIMENPHRCQKMMDAAYEKGDAIGWSLTEGICFAFERWTLDEFNAEVQKIHDVTSDIGG